MRIPRVVALASGFLALCLSACSSDDAGRVPVVEYPLICGLLGDVPTLAGFPTCVVETHGPCRIDEQGPSSTTFTFGDDGRLLTETREVPNPATRLHEYEDDLLVKTTQAVTAPFVVDYTYDAEGRLDGWEQTITNPATVALAYNGNDRLQTLTQSGADDEVRTYAYNSAGRLTGWTRVAEDSSEVTIAYDGSNRVSVVTQESEEAPYVITYEYAATGALMGWERTGTDPSEVTILYGDDGRVAEFKQTGTDAGTYTFVYDCE